MCAYGTNIYQSAKPTPILFFILSYLFFNRVSDKPLFITPKPAWVRSLCAKNKGLQNLKILQSFNMVETVGIAVRYAYYSPWRPNASHSVPGAPFSAKNLALATFINAETRRGSIPLCKK